MGLANTSVEAIAVVQELVPDLVLVDFYLGRKMDLTLYVH